MPISKYDNVTSSQKNVGSESVSFSTPNESGKTSTIIHNLAFIAGTVNNNNKPITVSRNRHTNNNGNNNIAIPTTTVTTDCAIDTLTNNSVHHDRGVIYATGSYDTSAVPYTPPDLADGISGQINNNGNPLNYQCASEHKVPTSNDVSYKTCEYSQINTVPYDNIANSYEKRPFDIDSSLIWKNNGYYLDNGLYADLPVPAENNSLNNICNASYLREPHTTTIPAAHRTAPVKLKETINPAYAENNTAFYKQNNVSPSKQHNMEGYSTPASIPTSTQNVAPYDSSPMISYGSPTSPRYVPCKVNPILKKSYVPQFKHNSPINYTAYPSYSFNNSYCESMPSDYIPYDPMRRGMVPPPIAPVSYVVMKEKDKRCILQKGIDCAMNSCKLNRNSHYPKHEYFIKGTRGTPMGTVLPYVTFQDDKKFDMFKRLTLKVGACLDDLINVFIESLNSSIEVLHENNVVKLHDLYPFYNPDPAYTRPERPTLKTGNNIIDNINNALDSTTLEKHKNLPKSTGRIPVPKTEKTGHVVVDGLNSILDNLLNEPLSYQKYDYYSDKVNVSSKST